MMVAGTKISPGRLVPTVFNLVTVLIVVSCPSPGFSKASSLESTPLYYVPSDVRPGYVVAEVETHRHEHLRIVNIKDDLKMRHLFSISKDGRLVVRKKLEEFHGRTFMVEILHKPENALSWSEHLLVQVTQGARLIEFTHQPYIGSIKENEDPGTKVEGLETLEMDLKKLPYGCSVELSGFGEEFFYMEGLPSHPKLISRTVFDRERQAFTSLSIKAKCQEETKRAVITVRILDDNDNVPVFEKHLYQRELSLYEIVEDPDVLVQVHAEDADFYDTVTYSMSPSRLFTINSFDGCISAKDLFGLSSGKTYEMLVTAHDTVGHVSNSALVRISIKEEQYSILEIHRFRRSTVRPQKTFVVRKAETGQLFTVAEDNSAELMERFEFASPEPDGLVLDMNTGIVSLENGFMWNDTTFEISFTVNVTRENDVNFQDDLPVFLHLVDRNVEDPIFTNLPRPMVTTIPMWIRPDTVIYTVEAIDMQQPYNAPVTYRIESGDEGCFSLDAETGEIKIACRQEFIPGMSYQLSLSAQVIGAIQKEATLTQILSIFVDEMTPIFYMDYTLVEMPETLQNGQVVVKIQGVSFQDLPLTYSITQMDAVSDGVFSMPNANTGDVVLISPRDHKSDPHQYRMVVRMVEGITNLEASTDLVINLVGENINDPYFPGTVYPVKSIPENIALGESVNQIMAVDLDQGINGELTFTVSDPHFRAEANGKVANIIVNQRLDYDIQPRHHYDFTLTATDGGTPPRSGTTRVQVWVTEIKDEAPVFDPPVQVVRVNQDAGDGVVIHVVQAYDLDENDPITFAFGGTPPSPPYNLDVNTGVLSLTRKIQSGDSTNLTIIVSDNNGMSTTGYVVIETIGVNHPPIFPQCGDITPGTVVLPENQPIGTSIINITLIETDPGVNGEVTIRFQFNQATEEQLFDIGRVVDNGGGEYSVELVSNIDFDREDPHNGVYYINGEQAYKATLVAQDNGTPKLNTTCFFFVIIQDQNDREPRFDENPEYKAIIKNDLQQGAKAVRVFAVDDDIGTNAEFDYILTDDPQCPDCFNIDSQTGWITRGSGNLGALAVVTPMVTADDRVNQGEDIRVRIEITNNDADVPPIWQQAIDDIGDYALYENVSFGFLNEYTFTTNKPGLLTIRPGRTIFENSNLDFREFVAGEQNLTLRVATSLDYEEVTEYSIRLRASARDAAQNGPYNDARLRISLLDVNDNVPEFVGVLDETNTYVGAVSDQTQLNDVIVKVIAIDRDGTPEHNTITYSFDEGFNNDWQSFGLNPTTGDIYATQGYSPEISPFYLLNVIATDSSPSPDNNFQPNSDDILVRIVVTGTSQAPPFFDEDVYLVNVESGVMIGTNITSIQATDPLDGLNAMQYRILEGNEARRFAVLSTEGVIYTTAELLFETQDFYSLTYGVFDGFETRTTTVNITVQSRNVYPPEFTFMEYDQNSPFTEDEAFSTTNPLVLQTVSATDREDGSSITYSVEGVYVTGNRFDILDTGDVLLQQTLDRDYPFGHANWLITVVATDNDGNPASQSGYAILNVRPDDINDNAPKFDVCCVIGYIEENMPTGTSVLQLSAVDYDEGPNAAITYGKVMFPQNGAGTDLFRITNAGLISTNVDGSFFDREVQDTYQALVFAEDNGTPIYRTNQTIDIIVLDANDNPPQFLPGPYVFEVDEELPVNTGFGAVFAEDLDIGINGRLTFQIINPPIAQEYFYMDSLYAGQAGLLRIRKRLNYENVDDPKTFNFEVRVNDPSNSDVTQVTVTVVNINDNAPVITPAFQTVNVAENNPTMPAITYSATDADSPGRAIDFMIDYEGSDPEKKFWIDPSSGVVTLVKPLDRETVENYELYIWAVDRGSPPMTGTATLNVTVTDENDNRPYIVNIDPPFPVVGPTTTDNTLVFTITIEDPDITGGSPVISYPCNRPLCNDFTFQFDNANTGSILTNQPAGYYDRQALGIDYYDLEFELTDGAGTPATEVVRVYIESRNYNPHAPGQSNILVFNYKGQLPDTQIGRVYCEDEDDWDLADKQFTIVGGTNEFFEVSMEEGVITIKQGTPRGEHILDVEVMDNTFTTTVTCTTTVTVVYLYDEAITSSGSIKISGVTSETFIERLPDGTTGVLQESIYQKLVVKLLELLPSESGNLHIYNVVDVEENTIDVMITVEGPDGYYRPAKVNGIIWTNKEQLETDFGITIESAPISHCMDDLCFGSGCATVVEATGDANPVLTNQTSLIGIATSVSQECVCAHTNYTDAVPVCEANTCANGGMCEEYYNGYVCVCPDGFDGPHCEQTKLSFAGDGWAWFDHLPSCDTLKISFQFMTTQQNALLFYNGPMFNQAETEIMDYISVELSGGYPTVKVDVGNGELSLQVNGQDQSGNNAMGVLNNGEWHTIEIFKEGKDFRLLVDNCRSMSVNETIDYSYEDRTPCEAEATTFGVNNLLNVFTPLELGGRAKPSVDRPGNLPTTNLFTGCMKDVWINGLLYDLHIGGVGESVNTEDNCPNEGCDVCSNNTICIGNLNGGVPLCICPPGFTGVDCDVEVPVIDFTEETSYIEWELKPEFNTTRNHKLSEVQLQFRTRKDSGMIFKTSSFSELERSFLEVYQSSLQYRYDLGSGDRILSLPFVNVSDGEWHTAKIRRFGTQVILQLDHGEGKYQAEAWPIEDFRLLVMSGEDLSGGAVVDRHPYDNTDVTVTFALSQSCVRDVRVDQSWFPLAQNQNSQSDSADVTDVNLVLNTCNSAACAGVNCPFGFCQDVWREHMCMCPEGQMIDTGRCVDITDCSIERCINGDCVMVPDPDNPGSEIWRCNCWPGWEGTHCNVTFIDPGLNSATVSTGWMVSVAIALILLLIIILIVVCCTKRRKAGILDEPDDAREMFKDYNEEGAGEDDMHGYDLQPLQKPYEVPVTTIIKEKPMIPEDLPRAAPEPLHQQRAPVILPATMPKDYPNVGRFIIGRLGDADDDPAAPPYDSVREYEYEGAGSSVGSLSSVATSSSGGDQDFEYLNRLGTPFRKLADIYLGGDEEEDNADGSKKLHFVVGSGETGYLMGTKVKRTLSNSDSHLPQSLAEAAGHSRELSMSDGNVTRGILRNTDSRQSFGQEGEENRRGILKRSSDYEGLNMVGTNGADQGYNLEQQHGYSSQQASSGGQMSSSQSAHQSQNVRIVTTTVTRHTTHSENLQNAGVPQPLTGDTSPPVALSSGQFDSVDLVTPPHDAYGSGEQHGQYYPQPGYNTTSQTVTTNNRLWNEDQMHMEEYGDV